MFQIGTIQKPFKCMSFSHKQNTYSSTAQNPNNSRTSNALSLTKELWGKYANDLKMS